MWCTPYSLRCSRAAEQHTSGSPGPCRRRACALPGGGSRGRRGAGRGRAGPGPAPRGQTRWRRGGGWRRRGPAPAAGGAAGRPRGHGPGNRAVSPASSPALLTKGCRGGRRGSMCPVCSAEMTPGCLGTDGGERVVPRCTEGLNKDHCYCKAICRYVHQQRGSAGLK